MKYLLCLGLLILLSGCGITRHSGKVKVFDASGEPISSYIATLDRPMMMKIVDPNGVTVEVDSRGVSSWGDFIKGMMEIITLGLVVK